MQLACIFDLICGLGLAILDAVVQGEVVELDQVLVDSHDLLVLEGLLFILLSSVPLLLLLNEPLDL